ncbi:MAG: tRNA-dihydrouridine synthase [Candidatus Pacearchaeota archaeon]|jgi:dihydroorotate dehydrogenase (NAD+) catalytic subunit
MEIKKIQIREKEVMPFTIPSGIITTSIASLEKLAQEIPELGILTTKSIGPKPREGNREPILGEYLPGCFVNAVGLTNPGVESFREELSRVHFPSDKFLLASIFGKDDAEFVYVAKTLESSVDGFELNLSCPHAKGYGMQLGQDPGLVYEITRAVVRNVKIPVFAKLTPNAGNIGEIAKAAVSGGVEGIVAINTVGPGCYIFDGHEVLTNKIGGLSGRGITPIGIKCVRDIRQAVGENVPIIGMGGISSAKDVRNYKRAGANIFGIGSTLAGMSDRELKAYFGQMRIDLEANLDYAGDFLKKVDMSYKKFYALEIENPDCDFKVIRTDSELESKPGQFVFAWIPGIGEKPFSIMDNSPLTLGVLARGEFTREFNSLKKGDELYVRGPYGKSVEVPNDSQVVLVGGGCGIAGLYLLAKRLSEKAKVLSLLGAKDKQHLPYLERFSEFGEVGIVTENGSLGKIGNVRDLLKTVKITPGSYFFNCGPRAMIEAVLPLELEVSNKERIYSSVDYMTRCGIGICGSCADPKGKRTCVEGPFMSTK